MPLSPETEKAVNELADLLHSVSTTEETVLQSSSRILGDKTILATQRIQLSNLLVASSADIRNAITRIQQAVQQAKQL